MSSTVCAASATPPASAKASSSNDGAVDNNMPTPIDMAGKANKGMGKTPKDASNEGKGKTSTGESKMLKGAGC